MKISGWLLVFASGLALVAGQKDSGNDSASNARKEKTGNDSARSDQEPKKTGKSPENGRRHKQEFLITPDDLLTILPRLQGEGEDHPSQNVYLSDDTGRYQVQVQNYNPGNPSRFQATLGAISAHILNRNTHREYVPYPPNGDPRDYPAYRGHPHATEPPAVRAYEAAGGPHLGPPPSPLSGRLLSGEALSRHFPDRFQDFGLGFYEGGEFYDGGEFSRGSSRGSDGAPESGWGGEERGGRIERFL